MRLDKFLTHTGTLTRKQANAAAKAGKLCVNGIAVKRSDIHIDPENDIVHYAGQPISYHKYTYIMMNKPAGIVSATNDPKQKTVIDLLPEALQKIHLFPCGRLDKDTLGLLILTNDGASAHNLLSPKKHAEKVYAFHCRRPVTPQNQEQLEQGICLSDGYQTKPCKIKMEQPTSGFITLTEGKYHQIKRMFEAVDNQILYLERISFAGIQLDSALPRGAWRPLSTEEEAAFTRTIGQANDLTQDAESSKNTFDE
ncbi:MAG: rRNA pseudouridine synthase [Clostridiales bacterium]|nr:rRNA pseudouridine synthase [Clostridiales bacterium]